METRLKKNLILITKGKDLTINDILDNWNNVDGNAKLMTLNRIIAESLDQFMKGDDTLIKAFFNTALTHEQNEGFGEEGLNV